MFLDTIKSTEDGSTIPHRQLTSEYEEIRVHPSKEEKIPGQPHDADGKFIHTYLPYAGRCFLKRLFITLDL